jgi:tellurite resistance protein
MSIPQVVKEDRSPKRPGRLRPRVPPNLFAIPLGIAGLAQAWHAAVPLLGTPQAIPDALSILDAALWLVLVVAYLAQGPRIIMADLRDPVLSAFVPVFALTAMLLAPALAPDASAAARILVVVFLAVTMAIGGWLTGQWMTGGIEPESVHPGYYLHATAGGLIGANAAVQVHLHALAQASFGVGVLSWAALSSVILNRLFTRRPLPSGLVPTMAIELGVAAVAGSAYFALTDRTVSFVACALGGYAVVMVLVQIRLIPVYRRLPFTPGFWSFAFSYAAAASDALVWLAIKKPPAATGYAVAIIALITAFVAWIAFRTVVLTIRRQLFPPWPPVHQAVPGLALLWDSSPARAGPRVCAFAPPRERANVQQRANQRPRNSLAFRYSPRAGSTGSACRHTCGLAGRCPRSHVLVIRHPSFGIKRKHFLTTDGGSSAEPLRRASIATLCDLSDLPGGGARLQGQPGDRDDDGRYGRWHDWCVRVRVAKHPVTEEGTGGHADHGRRQAPRRVRGERPGDEAAGQVDEGGGKGRGGNAWYVQVADGVHLQAHRERAQSHQGVGETGRRSSRDPHSQEDDLRDQRDGERDRHPARPRLDDVVVFCFLIAVEFLEDRHRQRGADRERGEGDDDRDRVRAGGLAGASDTDPEQNEVSGHSRREDLPEGQEADRLVVTGGEGQPHKQPVANCQFSRRRVRGGSVHNPVIHDSSLAESTYGSQMPPSLASGLVNRHHKHW